MRHKIRVEYINHRYFVDILDKGDADKGWSAGNVFNSPLRHEAMEYAFDLALKLDCPREFINCNQP